MINKPPPLNRNYSKDPNVKAPGRRGLLIRGLHSLQEEEDEKQQNKDYDYYVVLLLQVRLF